MAAGVEVDGGGPESRGGGGGDDNRAAAAAVLAAVAVRRGAAARVAAVKLRACVSDSAAIGGGSGSGGKDGGPAMAEAVEVAMAVAAAEPELLRKVEGAVSRAWLSRLLRTHVCGLGTWDGVRARNGTASGGRTCGGMVDSRHQVHGELPGSIPDP